MTTPSLKNASVVITGIASLIMVVHLLYNLVISAVALSGIRDVHPYSLCLGRCPSEVEMPESIQMDKVDADSHNPGDVSFLDICALGQYNLLVSRV